MLRLATRGSTLARAQAQRVADRLGNDTELVIVETAGDRATDVPILSIAGQGVFVAEVQQAVLDGRADVAVHSAKDLPSLTPDRLVIAAVPERADPYDVLVGARLAELPAGALVATGAPRRRAQLAHLRPDLCFAELRGNIETRLAKRDRFSAIVMAAAALARLPQLDLSEVVIDPLPIVPQVGQGTIALECRADDAPTRAALAAIDDHDAHAALRAERAFLREISELVGAGARGCDLAVGALADPDHHRVEVMLASLDGRVVLHTSVATGDYEWPEMLGVHAAEKLVHDHGGAMLLGHVFS